MTSSDKVRSNVLKNLMMNAPAAGPRRASGDPPGLSEAPAVPETLNGYVVEDARQPGGDQAHHVQENDDAGMLAH